ncbi:PAS domain-containing sensor histidine kinase [Cesiribacter andamanensis]|uniref:histidine kinase n=1 Tax=Cesiribacter andamanensis AMV16 TaxID=1279009 RepID=M7NZP5_9BACT|nr:HAMP domain-containing sensor histidine kinase [Cesiribacter andamanensis]EMR03819.1 Sensor histidine kinase YycG [Cesiribacter andamanensis AMV16]
MHSSITFLQQLVKQSTDLAFVYSVQEARFLYISESVAAFTGLAPDSSGGGQPQQPLPLRLLELVPQEEHAYLRSGFEELIEKGAGSAALEFRVQRPDQTLSWLRLKAYCLQEEATGNLQLLGMAEDITRRKEYELALLAMKEQKNIVIQVLGHDLRAPLNTISLSMSLMGRELNLEENKSVKQLVEIVERTCRNSLDMIKEVLNLEYLETQELGIKKTRIDLVARMQSQLDAFRLLDKANKTFILHTTTESIYTTIDSIRLMLIMENLLTNAYKFTEARGRIEVSLEERPHTILITVADNGIGIPDALKPLIFDKFTRARRKGTQGEQPVGLGMHLIKTMTDQLDGTIRFESQEGKGTTFYIELPK